MKNIKNSIRKLVPKSVLDNFHYPEAKYYSRKHNYPTDKMITIGIVGSKGKTTTANMLWSILSAAGNNVGQISTANIRIGQKEQLNKWHMTMPGSKKLQSLLAEMYKNNCNYVIMEVPSEAQTQWRHIGINFDIIIFTGVEKEIMAAHRNSMEVLHKHNKRVLQHTQKSPRKIIDGKIIEKTLILNTDNKYYAEYSSYNFDHKITYSIDNKSDFRSQNIEITPQGTKFNIKNNSYHLNIVGRVNVLNASGAIAAATSLGISNNKIKVGLNELKTIPGRMERIDEGQDFIVFVDYAHDQPSLLALLNTGKQLISRSNKIIVLFGGQGGGRDILRRAEMGEIAGKYADFVVVSNDDPYDDPPMQIIEDIAKGAKKSGKVLNKDLFLIEDRRSGIHKALELAKPNDLVFVACKGADQLMMVAGGKSLPWDEREVTREELKKLLKN